MGACCSSDQLDKTYYEKPMALVKTKKATNTHCICDSPLSSATSKRSMFSRRSSASSGIYSRGTTPTTSGYLSTPKTSKYDRCKGNMPAQRKLNLSCGYHSQQTPSSSNTSSENLCYTRDTSEQQHQQPIPASSFDMELYMMTNSRNIMSNTSSPLVRHRNITFELDEKMASLPPATKRYVKWEQVLHKNPVTMIHNISNIPEALSGHFCPAHMPSYTQVKRSVKIENPPKRLKMHETYDMNLRLNATYVLSTDL